MVLGPANVFQVAVLWPHARIVEAGGDGVGVEDLAVSILHQVGAIAMQHADGAGIQRRGMPAGVQA